MNTCPWIRRMVWVPIVVLLATGLAWFFRDVRTGTPAEVQGSGLHPDVADPSAVAPNPWAGYGWSTQADPRLAVREAVGKAKAMLTKGPIVYAFIGTTAGYDIEAVRKELETVLDPKVKFHGITSALGIMTPDGFHRGKPGALAVLLVASPRIRFGISGVNLGDFPNQKEAGRRAILEAIRDVGVPDTQSPSLVLITPAKHTGGETQILEAIGEVIGKDVPVVGGDAADDTNKGLWREFTRGKVFQEGLVVTVLYSEAKVGWAFENGFRLTEKEGTVTRASGKVVQEINHRPALEVYDEWLNRRLTEAMAVMNPVDLMKFCAQNPLCQVFRGKEGQIGYRTVHPLPLPANLQDRYLPMASPIPEGTPVRLFTGTWQTVLNRAEYLPTKAMLQGELKPQETGWGLVFFCRGATRLIPEDELPKVPLLVRNGFRGIPFVGMITTGEQGPLPGICNIHANLAESMVTIGK